MDFPCLTGRKSWTGHGNKRSTTLHTNLSNADIHNATASAGALPIAALQAAWSVILSTYVGAHDNVVFGTILTSNSTNSDSYHVIPTEAPLFTSGSWNPAIIGHILNQLTESTTATSRSKKQSARLSATWERLGRGGTTVAYYGENVSQTHGPSYAQRLQDHSFALSISAFPSTDGLLKIQASYTDLVLDEPSASVLLAHLEDLLTYITSNPTKKIESSRTAIRPSLLSLSNQNVPQVNGFHAEAPLLHSQFENTARENPDLPALEFWHDVYSERFTSWTYGELNARADVLAKYLKNRFGQLSDTPVPICMERCPELYVAILGILKSGGAWCPVDASFPARRRHDLIARTGSQILIVADRNRAEKIDGIPQGVVVVDITKIDATSLQHVELSNVQMGSLAYLIWTSGTTGAPKGVPIHHEAALTSMTALQRSIPTDVTGGVVRCIQFSHFTFDVFVQDLFYTWGVGGSIISSTRGIMLGSFAELANKTKATHAHLTPTFAASVPRQRCTSLEVITMIGEKLSQVVADDWGQNMRAFNTYGPAETAVVSTFRQFGAADDEIQSENVGYPLPSVFAFVMRDGLALMRHGVGELALGGPQLSKGYWNDPEKTAGRFVWNEQYSCHLYMTGDMVRQLHDGSLVFVGREDDLIKIQGIRVELSEISFGLQACHPLVEQVETQFLARQDRPSKVIVAFLAAPMLGTCDDELIGLEQAAPIAKIALLEGQKNLPDYMVPRVLLMVKSIPRTPSNKIDRNKLKEIYSSSDLAAWEAALAGSVTEEADWDKKHSSIIATIAELSGTSQESMSRHSDLRSIGIDSIAATKLAPVLHQRGFPISVAGILQCQNLDDIVHHLERSGPRRQQYDLEAFHNHWYDRVRKEVQRDDFVVVPTLPLQESLLSESLQNAKAYWSNTFLSLNVEVDLTRLKEAWMQVVNGTEALRTGFVPSAAVADEGDARKSTFLQMIYDHAALDWNYFEVTQRRLEHIATEQAQQVAERHQRDSFVDPPISITLFAQPKSYTMMVSVHHSVRDEPSLDFMLEDVWKAYTDNDVNHRNQSREALRLLLPTETQIEQDEQYWSKILSDFATADDATTFPDLSGGNLKGTESFVTHVQPLSTDYKALQDAAITSGATSAASILRVAWGCILLMYLETESTVFAETSSDRIDDPSLEDVVGPLTSVLPVPFRARGSAREVLVAQADIQQNTRSHRTIHGRAIRKLLQRPEHQSLYPALFNFLPAAGEADKNQWSPEWRKLESLIPLTVEHPLALNVTPTSTGTVELELIGNSHVISSTHLAIVAQQVDAMVKAMLRDPDVPLRQLTACMPPDLLSKTSVTFSEEVKLASKQDPLHWVDHYAKVQPHWPAALFFSSIDQSQYNSWDYAELQSAYKRVATFIRSRGLRHKMIAVCLDRRLEAYAVVLGILASGNTYLPIDEDLPDERKSFLIQDSQAVLLFTISDLASPFRNTEARLVFVDDKTYMDVVPNGHPVAPKAISNPHDNAYLLYTSGSTGVPKGALVGRGNLCSFIEGLSEYIHPRIPGMNHLPGKGRYLGLASRAFDVHLAEMFLAWRRGLAAVTAPRTLLLDDLEHALQAMKITHASFVPSLIDQAGLDPANLPDLHYLGVGGEKMSKRTVDTWAASDSAALVNAYGPTEMSIGCTAAEVTSGSNLRNIGRPYGNSVAHVLVPGSNEYTLRGVAGELCFTGDLVANGYHNRPDAKGFVENFHGKRMYRTGDIVRLMADDTLEYLRRDDDQTKVRGQRLELGEISEAIRSSVMATLGSDKIDVATIVAQHPKLLRPQLVSFIVPRRSESDSPEMLRAVEDREMAGKILDHCQKVLPSYMVPDVVLPLSRVPLAPSSGKADQKRLKSLFTDLPIEDLVNRPGETASHRQKLSDSEKVVRGAVMSTLAVDGAEISPNTNIFRLGLESLSAINLAIKLQKLGYECTVSGVLKNPTLERLALLPQRKAERVNQTYSYIAEFRAKFLESHPDKSSQTVRPCLPLQETLVASSMSDRSRALYVNSVVLKLSATIDTVQLEKAFRQVVADHDILRTCFWEFEGGFAQVVQKAQTKLWEEVIVTDLDAAVQQMRCIPPNDIVKEIDERPPLRLTLLRQTANEQSPVLLIQIHHALYDGVSFAMILEDLDKRYRSSDVPTHAPFESLLEHVHGQNRGDAKKFWMHYLIDFEPTSTMDHDATGTTSTTDRVLTTSIADLDEFSASIGGTLTSTVQAVFGIVLARTFNTHDVVFGAVLSGRTVPIENPNTIVAPCLTTIPQRVNLGTDNSDVVEIMKVAREGFVESLTHQHTALRHIHRWLEADKPLFDCLVTYVQQKSRFSSNLWTELEGSMANEFPLAVEFEAANETNQMRVHCAFTSAFGNMPKATALLEDIDLLLGALVREENVTTQDLGISQATSPKPSPRMWDESYWSPVELKMREITARTCGIHAREVSKGSSFFGLGIDSITAIRFAQQLRRAQIECSSADVMRHTCIGTLAQHIVGSDSRVDDIKAQGIDIQVIPEIPILCESDVVIDAYRCTPLQSSMLTQTLGSGSELYAHHHALRLSDAIDISRLKEVWGRLVAQTEILRTTFHFATTRSAWVAAVRKDSPQIWAESDSLNRITQGFTFHDDASFERLPWKTTIWRRPGENVLVVSMHHSLYDGVSINLLFQDLSRLYKGAEIQPRPSFSDAAKAISQTTRDAEDFWLQKLNGYPGSRYLFESKVTGITNMEHTLDVNLYNALQGCKELGVTLQTVALLAYAKSLACISEQRDVVFGNVVGGRSLAVPGADDIIGPLFNTVPFRIALEKTYVSNASMVKDIQQASGDAQANQHASLASIQQTWLQRAGNTDAQLFDSVFVFLNNMSNDSTIDSLGTPIDIGGVVDPTEYSLNVEVEQGKKNIFLRVNARMKGERLHDWINTFEQTFQDVLEHPSKSVLAFPSSLQGLPLHPKSNNQYGPAEPDVQSGPDLDIIQEALSVVLRISSKNISPKTSIFSLGLDSIAAIQVAAACRKQGYAISVADVLQGRSLAGICRRLRGRSGDTPGESNKETTTLVPNDTETRALALLGVADQKVEQILPCLAGQVYHLASWLKTYRTSREAVFTFQSSFQLNVDSISSAWRKLRGRHSILRTSFVAVSSTEVVQVVLKPSALDGDSFLSTDSDTAIQEELKRQADQHFNLFTPPAKLQHVRGSSQDFICLKLHHATYDAWTIPALISDLAALYQNINLPPPQPFAPFIKQTLESLHMSQEQTYWRKSLSDSQAAILNFPQTKTAAPSFITFPSAILSLSTLTQRCQQTSLSLPTLILSAFARTLAHHTSTTSPLFGLYQIGRSASFEGIETLCAPCLNITPICVPSALTVSMIGSAHRLQTDLAERTKYEQSFLKEVLEFAGMDVKKPVFNTFVNILSTPPSTIEEKSEKKQLFTPYRLSEEDAASLSTRLAITGEAMPSTKDDTKPATAVDALETGYLSDRNFYLDVVRREEGDCIDFAVKCDGGVMDEERVKGFVKEMVREVEVFVAGGEEERGERVVGEAVDEEMVNGGIEMTASEKRAE
ncbi:MAG: hypothetical protein Q9221_008280 [Calogaya cf. arnoldii]